MSTQSIINNISDADIAFGLDRLSYEMSHSYMMQVRFGLGGGYDKGDCFHIKMLRRIHNTSYDSMCSKRKNDFRIAVVRLLRKYNIF